MIHGFALVQSLCLPFGDLQLLDGVIFFEYEFCDRSVFCSTSIVRRNMRRLDAECRRCEAREISKQSDRLGVPPWWCDRTRYPDEPARIAREIMQGVIHLEPLQNDPSRGLGGPCGPYCR